MPWSEHIRFPMPTIRVGDCLAILSRNGEPLLGRYSRVRFGSDKAQWSASRLSYSLNCVEIPRLVDRTLAAPYVLHSCDHKWCIEPGHLSLGSQSQNVAEALERHPTFRTSAAAGAKRRASTPEGRAGIQRAVEASRKTWTPERRADQAERIRKLNQARRRNV